MDLALPRHIGSYHVTGLLGQGAMGCVYRARLPLLDGQEYAIKLLWEPCKQSEVRGFLGECSKVKRLGVHPNILLIHFAGRDRRLRRFYVVMELVDGQSAAQLLLEAPQHQLPLEQALQIAIQVALGLEHAHQRGVLHLDVKPSNILLERDGSIAKLADFGNAGLIDDTGWVSYPFRAGTPAYLAWEQTAQGRQAGLRPDARTDVYSLAVTLYELLTGYLPFAAGQDSLIPPTHWRSDLPEALEALLLRALNRDPMQRPGTISEFRSALQWVFSPAQVNSPPLSSRAQRLVGRDALLHDLIQRLLAGDSVALHGLPGVGKTALARALASNREIQNHFRDGVLWADLGFRPNIAAVLGSWGASLGLSSERLAKLTTIAAQAQAVRTAIGERRVLLVMDDVWEVETSEMLKLGGPNCTHLVTTRLPEVALRVADESAVAVRIPELSETDGLTLLERLAPAVVQNEPAEARALVRAIDGLPLALTLIGKYLCVQEYGGQPRRLRTALDQLQQTRVRLRLAHSLPPTQQWASRMGHSSLSLMASIDTSYQALNKPARSMLLALSIFPAKPNSFSEEAALTVTAGSTKTLDRLIDSGLLETSGPGRYTLHQTIADYARLKRQSKLPGERVARFFARYVEEHQMDSDALDRETVNVLAALKIASSQKLFPELVQGVNAFSGFLEVRGSSELAETLLLQAEQATRTLGDAAGLAAVLLNLARVVGLQGDYERVEEYLEEGLALAGQIGNPQTMSAFLQALGGLKRRRGDYAGALTTLEAGIVLARQGGDPQTLSALLRTLGLVVTALGDYTRAEACYQEALRLAREIGNADEIGSMLQNLGMIAKAHGDYQQAEANYQQAMVVFRQSGQVARSISLLNSLGTLSSNRGDKARAARYYQEGVVLARRFGQREQLGFLLNNLGELASDCQNYVQAEAYLQEGMVLARQMGQREMLGVILTNLGAVARKCGEYRQAQEYLEEALAAGREMQYSLLICYTLGERGELHLCQGQLGPAMEDFQESLKLARKLENQEYLASALYGLARVAMAQGHVGQARRAGEESQHAFEGMGHTKASEVAEWLAMVPKGDAIE